jgi:hypothetical protein
MDCSDSRVRLSFYGTVQIFVDDKTYSAPEADEDSDNGSDEDSFHYPSSPTSTARPASIRSHTTDYFTSSIPSGSRDPSDIAPHLLQSPEFRVPTHESPQKVLSPGWTAPTAHSLHAQWERDEIVAECRSCKRRFNFILRRVSFLVFLLFSKPTLNVIRHFY